MTARKKPEDRLKQGRPTKYDPARHPVIAAALAKGGATVEDIAFHCAVTKRTAEGWMRRYPDFLRATTASREDFDTQVENSLAKRALGMKVRTITVIKDGAGATIQQKVEEKEIPPDTNAMSLWLRNRQPARWRDKVELTGLDGGPIQHNVNVALTDEERADAVAALLAAHRKG